jgi:Putative peptidoglycan binding domain
VSELSFTSTLRSNRQTGVAAPLVTAALTGLMWACAALPAQAAHQPGLDAEIPAVEAPGAVSTTAGGLGSSVGLLARGAGYESPSHSEPVRELQRRLRRLGDDPGPIDGLYGPLTAGAVERFQLAHGLKVDGVVGPQTRSRLDKHAEPAPRRNAARTGTERSIERQSHASQGPVGNPTRHDRAGPASRAQPEGAGQETPAKPGYAPLVGVLAVALLLIAAWRLRTRRRRLPSDRAPDSRQRRPAGGRPDTWTRRRLNLGLACAALLAVFVVGAGSGAIFASQAAPDHRGDTTAEPLGVHGSPVVQRSAAQDRVTVGRRARAPTTADRAGPGARVYRVRAGDSLWAIAEERLGRKGPERTVARKVDRLVALNLDSRIASGDPDLIRPQEKLRLN